MEGPDNKRSLRSSLDQGPSFVCNLCNRIGLIEFESAFVGGLVGRAGADRPSIRGGGLEGQSGSDSDASAVVLGRFSTAEALGICSLAAVTDDLTPWGGRGRRLAIGPCGIRITG